MTHRMLPDEDIVRRFQETGDRECFSELFARYRKKVFFACYGFFRNGSEAEDATQETFLRAYQKIESFHGGDFVVWLIRIARNVCIDEWRKCRSRQFGNLEIKEMPVMAISPAPSFGTKLIVEKFWKEMRSLSQEQQQCLLLKIEGYSYEEIASRTSFSIQAVKSHLQNGRRMLWRKMEGAVP